MKRLTLRVTLMDLAGKVKGQPYRELAVPESLSLYELAEAINNSYDFDFDHAFGFFSDTQDPYASDRRYELFVDMDDEEFTDDEEDALEDLSPEERLEFEAAMKAFDEVSANLSEDELREALISSVLQGVPGDQQDEVRGMLEEALSDAEVPDAFSVKGTAVGEVLSAEGEKLLYMFDYGDDWRFLLEVKGLEEAAEGLQEVQVLSAVGDAPPQYPDLEDDDDEDDLGEIFKDE